MVLWNLKMDETSKAIEAPYLVESPFPRISFSNHSNRVSSFTPAPSNSNVGNLSKVENTQPLIGKAYEPKEKTISKELTDNPEMTRAMEERNKIKRKNSETYRQAKGRFEGFNSYSDYESNLKKISPEDYSKDRDYGSGRWSKLPWAVDNEANNFQKHQFRTGKIKHLPLIG